MMFKSLLEKIYHEMFDSDSAFYLPKIIDDGYDASGIRIKPLNSIALRDVNEWQMKRPLPGGCGLDFTCGDALLSLRNNVLTNLSSVCKVEGQELTVSNDDSLVRIPLAFSSLILSGDLYATQPCLNFEKKPYTKTYTGRYSVTLTGVRLIITATIRSGSPLSVNVHPFEIDVTGIAIEGAANETPPNLEKWWLLLANSKQVIAKLKSMLTEERTGTLAARWAQSVINRELARLSLAETLSSSASL